MRGKSHVTIGVLSAIDIAILCGATITPLGVAGSVFFSVMPDIDESNSNALEKFISKKTTDRIYSIIMYIVMATVFFFYIRTSDNVYISVLLAIIFMLVLEKYFTSLKLRSLILSSAFILAGFTMMMYRFNTALVALTFFTGIFPLLKHRTLSHSILMSCIIYILLRYIEKTTSVRDIAIMCSVAYISHLFGDMVTKRGIPLFYPFSSKNYSFASLKVGSWQCNLFETVTIILLSVLLMALFIFAHPKFGYGIDFSRFGKSIFSL